MKYKTYLVGGAVRDEILGKPNKDLDYVMLAPSFDAMRGALLEAGCKIFIEKPEYLTIRANHPTLGSVDFACARADGNYSDGRRPDETVITNDLIKDLSRRDFTIGAMAKDLETGEIIDPFDGRKDLAAGIVRAVGSARARFDEDRLRVFRALRFAVTKSLRLDHEIVEAIGSLTPMSFKGVSSERVREELFKMFQWDFERSFRMLFDFPVLLDVVRERQIWFRPTMEQK